MPSASYTQHVLNAPRSSVSLAIDLDDKGAKEYKSFATLDLAVAWYCKQPKKHIYEIVREYSPSCIAFDIDGCVTSDDPKKAESVRKFQETCTALGVQHDAPETLVDAVVGEIAKHFPQLAGQPFAVLQSHRRRGGVLVKVSFHIKFPGLFLPDQPAREHFKILLRRKLPHLNAILDTAVYTTNRSMRLAFAHKFGDESRPLLPVDDPPGLSMPDTVRLHMWICVPEGAVELVLEALPEQPARAAQAGVTRGAPLLTGDEVLVRSLLEMKLGDTTSRPQGEPGYWRTGPFRRLCLHGNWHEEDNFRVHSDGGNIYMTCLAEECPQEFKTAYLGAAADLRERDADTFPTDTSLYQRSMPEGQLLVPLKPFHTKQFECAAVFKILEHGERLHADETERTLVITKDNQVLLGKRARAAQFYTYTDWSWQFDGALTAWAAATAPRNVEGKMTDGDAGPEAAQPPPEMERRLRACLPERDAMLSFSVKQGVWTAHVLGPSPFTRLFRCTAAYGSGAEAPVVQVFVVDGKAYVTCLFPSLDAYTPPNRFVLKSFNAAFVPHSLRSRRLSGVPFHTFQCFLPMLQRALGGGVELSAYTLDVRNDVFPAGTSLAFRAKAPGDRFPALCAVVHGTLHLRRTLPRAGGPPESVWLPVDDYTPASLAILAAAFDGVYGRLLDDLNATRHDDGRVTVAALDLHNVWPWMCCDALVSGSPLVPPDAARPPVEEQASVLQERMRVALEARRTAAREEDEELRLRYEQEEADAPRAEKRQCLITAYV